MPSLTSAISVRLGVVLCNSDLHTLVIRGLGRTKRWRSLFDLAIDSKLRGRDLVKIEIGTLVAGQVWQRTCDRLGCQYGDGAAPSGASIAYGYRGW